MNKSVVAGLLLALLVSAGLPATDAFAYAGQADRTAGTIGQQSQSVEGVLTAARESRSNPTLTRASVPVHAARHGRTLRVLRRPTEAKSLYSLVPSLPAPGASRLETRQAELPSQYFLIHLSTAPRAPARA